MQLRQYARPIPRRELHRLEFTAPVGAQAQVELVRIVVTADYRGGALEIGPNVVRVGHGQRGGVQGDYGDAGQA